MRFSFWKQRAETKVSIACDRCLAPVTTEIHFNIEERFSHTGRDDEETETFSGDQIDLADYVRSGIMEAHAYEDSLIGMTAKDSVLSAARI